MKLRKFIATTIREYLNEQQEVENNFNDAFLKWFGSSKVKDNDGTPKIVYRTQKKQYPHGTFKESKYVFGIYFSEDEKSTKIYGDVTESFYLSLQNPKILRGIEYDEMWIYSIITKDKYQKLMDDGYDGAIWLKNGIMYEIVVFDKDKIKSTNNDGTWDIGDNNIYS